VGDEPNRLCWLTHSDSTGGLTPISCVFACDGDRR
jgi:hypothetical protein